MAGKRKSRSDSPSLPTAESTQSEKIVLKDEESEDDEGSVIGVCPCKEDCVAGRPSRLKALDYPHIVSQIIDEAVMRMKDCTDEANYADFFRSKYPPGTLSRVIRQTEVKYALPKGTIKESTVKSRMKAYKKKDKSLSLLPKIEQPLLRWCLREAHMRSDERPEEVLWCLTVINMAKTLLQEKQRRLDGDDLIRYNPAKDWMKLDWNWVHEFKRRAFDVFEAQGIRLEPREEIQKATPRVPEKNAMASK